MQQKASASPHRPSAIARGDRAGRDHPFGPPGPPGGSQRGHHARSCVLSSWCLEAAPSGSSWPARLTGGEASRSALASQPGPLQLAPEAVTAPGMWAPGRTLDWRLGRQHETIPGGSRRRNWGRGFSGSTSGSTEDATADGPACGPGPARSTRRPGSSSTSSLRRPPRMLPVSTRTPSSGQPPAPAPGPGPYLWALHRPLGPQAPAVQELLEEGSCARQAPQTARSSGSGSPHLGTRRWSAWPSCVCTVPAPTASLGLCPLHRAIPRGLALPWAPSSCSLSSPGGAPFALPIGASAAAGPGGLGHRLAFLLALPPLPFPRGPPTLSCRHSLPPGGGCADHHQELVARPGLSGLHLALPPTPCISCPLEAGRQPPWCWGSGLPERPAAPPHHPASCRVVQGPRGAPASRTHFGPTGGAPT
ncbi:uncharacterized protein LOC144615099 [Panthera onca]